MLERPKISPSQQPKSLGISPSDLGFRQRDRKRAQKFFKLNSLKVKVNPKQ